MALRERAEANDVAANIISAKASGGCFLVGRYSHCESRVMGFGEFSSRDDVNKSLRLQLGRDDFSDTEVLDISIKIRESYSLCDYVGLADEEHLKSSDVYLNELLANVGRMEIMYNLSRPGQKYCSTNIHLELLTHGLLSEIISKFQDVVLISCRDIGANFEAFFGISPIQIFVPQENRTAGLAENVLPAWHYPDVYFTVLNKIDEYVKPGTLVLTGAGFLGKIYNARAKIRGGIAIDLGSVFDVWAGVRSRSGFSDRIYEKFYLPEATRTTKQSASVIAAPTLMPARKDWTVDEAGRQPRWMAASSNTASVRKEGRPNAASMSGNEIFVHSSHDGSNFIEFLDLSIEEVNAFAVTLLVSNAAASSTVFFLELTTENGSFLSFKKVCRADDTLHWLQLMPVPCTISRIKISTLPVPGGNTQYGWAYLRGLRLL